MAAWSKRSLSSLVGVLASVALSACGGGALGEAATPEQDSLAADLEQRAADLDAELAKLERQGKGTETVDSAAPVPELPAPGEAPASSVESVEAPEKKQSSKRSRCQTACRALASMERSSERICSLVGDSHDKCTWARSQVDKARERVARAGCSCEK